MNIRWFDGLTILDGGATVGVVFLAGQLGGWSMPASNSRHPPRLSTTAPPLTAEAATVAASLG